MAYRLALSIHLSKIHIVFHMYLVKKVVLDSSQVLSQMAIEIREDLIYEVKPVKVTDLREKHLWNKVVPEGKVIWKKSQVENETLERELEIKRKYLKLFLEEGDFLFYRQNLKKEGRIINPMFIRGIFN